MSETTVKNSIDALSPQERLVYERLKEAGPIPPGRLAEYMERRGDELRKRKPQSVRAVCQRLFKWNFVRRSKAGDYWVIQEVRQ